MNGCRWSIPLYQVVTHYMVKDKWNNSGPELISLLQMLSFGNRYNTREQRQRTMVPHYTKLGETSTGGSSRHVPYHQLQQEEWHALWGVPPPSGTSHIKPTGTYAVGESRWGFVLIWSKSNWIGLHRDDLKCPRPLNKGFCFSDLGIIQALEKLSFPFCAKIYVYSMIANVLWITWFTPVIKIIFWILIIHFRKGSWWQTLDRRGLRWTHDTWTGGQGCYSVLSSDGIGFTGWCKSPWAQRKTGG